MTLIRRCHLLKIFVEDAVWWWPLYLLESPKYMDFDVIKRESSGLYPMLAYTCYYCCDVIVLGPNWENPRVCSQFQSHLTCAWYCGCPSSIGHCPLLLDLTLLPNKVMLSLKLLAFIPSLLPLNICLLSFIYSLFQKWMMLLNIVIIIRTVALAIWQWTCHDLLSLFLLSFTNNKQPKLFLGRKLGITHCLETICQFSDADKRPCNASYLLQCVNCG